MCDRVIALVGDAYGFEASGDAVPARTPPRSYTQWEYFLAKNAGKKTYTFFTDAGFIADEANRAGATNTAYDTRWSPTWTCPTSEPIPRPSANR